MGATISLGSFIGKEQCGVRRRWWGGQVSYLARNSARNRPNDILMPGHHLTAHDLTKEIFYIFVEEFF